MNGARAQGRLPITTKLLYGAGDIGVALSMSAMVTYLLFFYTDVAGLGVGLAGLVSGIARFWDAIVDPPMGYISDKTRTRIGRRRFWFGIAAIPLGASVYAVFSPPIGLTQLELFGWMLTAYLSAYLFFTMFLTPYYALGAELSDDPEERTQIVAIRIAFQFIGSFVGGFMPILALRFGGARQGYGHVAGVFGAVAAAAILLAFFGARERTVKVESKPSFGNFWKGLRGSLSNRPFRILLISFVAMSVGAGVSQSVLVYALIYWLKFKQSDVGLLIPAVLAAATLSLIFWTFLSARIGKARTLQALFVYMTIFMSAAYFLVPFKPLVWTILIFQGFGFGGYMVAGSLLADVLDHDELATGEQRGGAFFGFWTFASKFGAGIGPPVVGLVLWLAGYAPNHVQSPRVIEVLRLLFGPISALFFLAAAIIIHRFPLSRQAHLEIQREVHRRRLARNEPTPVVAAAGP